jgi:hypothetical protein
MDPTSANSVLHLVARLSAVGVCLTCLEPLSRRLWPGKPAEGGRAASVEERAARWGTGTWHRAVPALVLCRLALGMLLLVSPSAGPYWKWYVVGLLIVSFLVCIRLPMTKGADAQLNLITYGAIALTLFADTPTAATYCLYFLTLQLCLAYFAAGYHKLRSPSWRNGYALPGLLSTRLFGTPALAAWLDRRVVVSLVLCWATIVWEVSFPVVLVAPRPVVWCYLGCGVLFHPSTAVVMGLNKFIWAFLALCPAAIFCTLGSLLLRFGGSW